LLTERVEVGAEEVRAEKFAEKKKKKNEERDGGTELSRVFPQEQNQLHSSFTFGDFDSLSETNTC
jgi:hypothetical protein